jgi:hypothetical protein
VQQQMEQRWFPSPASSVAASIIAGFRRGTLRGPFELSGPPWGTCWEAGGLLPQVECHGRSAPISTIVAADCHLQSLARWRKSWQCRQRCGN